MFNYDRIRIESKCLSLSTFPTKHAKNASNGSQLKFTDLKLSPNCQLLLQKEIQKIYKNFQLNSGYRLVKCIQSLVSMITEKFQSPVTKKKSSDNISKLNTSKNISNAASFVMITESFDERLKTLSTQEAYIKGNKKDLEYKKIFLHSLEKKLAAEKESLEDQKRLLFKTKNILKSKLSIIEEKVKTITESFSNFLCIQNEKEASTAEFLDCVRSLEIISNAIQESFNQLETNKKMLFKAQKEFTLSHCASERSLINQLETLEVNKKSTVKEVENLENKLKKFESILNSAEDCQKPGEANLHKKSFSCPDNIEDNLDVSFVTQIENTPGLDGKDEWIHGDLEDEIRNSGLEDGRVFYTIGNLSDDSLVNLDVKDENFMDMRTEEKKSFEGESNKNERKDIIKSAAKGCSQKRKRNKKESK